MVRSQRLRRTRRMTRTTRLLTDVASMRFSNGALVAAIVLLMCAIALVDRVQQPAVTRAPRQPIIILATAVPAPAGATGLAKAIERAGAKPAPTIAPADAPAPAPAEAPAVVEAAPPTAEPQIVQAAAAPALVCTAHGKIRECRTNP